MRDLREQVSRALLVPVITLAALCASGVAVDGPLAYGGAATICIPSPDGQAMAVGYTAMTNNGPATVTIDHVALRQANGVTLAAAYLVPITEIGDMTLSFGASEYPPSFEPEDGYPELEDAWNKRVEAVGGEVGPAETLDLVVALQPSADGPATNGGVELVYSERNGRSYQADSSIKLEIRVGRKSCF